MVFNALERTAVLDELAPGKIYVWEGDLWEGLVFDNPADKPNYDDFLSLYNTRVEESAVSIKTLYFEEQIQKMLDSKAIELGYDSIHTAVTYAEEDSVAKFKQEGLSLRAWRSLVWDKSYEILSDVAAGNRTEPTLTELFAELPTFNLIQV